MALENRPLDNKPSELRKYLTELVESLCEILEEHAEGHALVFLPGQPEIEQTIDIFNREKSASLQNCTALPLFGSMSPEDQSKASRWLNRVCVCVCVCACVCVCVFTAHPE